MDGQSKDAWKIDDVGSEVEEDHVGGFVVRFDGPGVRPPLAAFQQAINAELRKREVDPRDVISINPILSLAQREVWYYKGAGGD